MAIQHTVRMPGVWEADVNPQDRVKAVQVSMPDYDVEVLQIQSEYERRTMRDARQAMETVIRMREEMCRSLAEQIYDHLEFNDFEDFERDAVIMRGRIQILRRKD